MLRHAFRALWTEPRVPSPPVRVWRDWALLAALIPVAVLETFLREDLTWPAASGAMCVGLLFTLLWRRTAPLHMIALAFGASILLDVASLIAGVAPVGLGTFGFVLILIYALFRWGSGTEMVYGLAVMLLAYTVGMISDEATVGDLIGGGIVMAFPVALGTAMRLQGSIRVRTIDEAKARERVQLARELHDTVAHHVSAIAIRAQAGRALAPSHPEAAVDALKVIEEEASRTLTEMRSMVAALRQSDEPDLSPQPGIGDIERLAQTVGEVPRIEVELSGELGDLSPAVDVAIYRLAQESVTNAMRHARSATRIRVSVTGDEDSVSLTVADDGAARPHDTGPGNGYGIVGMNERTTLLGGTLNVGPGPSRGWRVDAVLPRNGTAL